MSQFNNTRNGLNTGRNVNNIVNSRKVINKTPVQTPCCKVCKDAGKDESIFATHWAKDSSGNVICPTLLEQECRWCKEKGHTVKYCKKLAKKNEDDQKKLNQQKYTETNAKKTTYEQPTNKGRFSLLLDDDDDESESNEDSKSKPKQLTKQVQQLTKEEYPELGGVWKKREYTAPVAGISFISMACKPKEEAIAEKSLRDAVNIIPQNDIDSQEEIQERNKKIAEFFKNQKKSTKKNWADEEDSDDEE